MCQQFCPRARLLFRPLPAVAMSVLWMVPITAYVSRLEAQSAGNVLLVVNRRDRVSQAVADYYARRRGVPASHFCLIETTSDETIDWDTYTAQIEAPVAACLKREHLEEQVLYILTTMGVPLRIDGMGGSIQKSEQSSVDSELTLLYAKLHGSHFERAGPVPNPFFARRDSPFLHPQFPIYLVTRLAANDLADVRAMIDRSLSARNRGMFVLDASSPTNGEGNNWLREAALLLPRGRVVLDDTPNVLYKQRNVIGYASWGSNDGGRKQRWLGFEWLPGAIVTEFVSTDARTLKAPPPDWNLTTYTDREHWFAGSPQTLSADYIHEGATGASGNVYEPYLTGCARPEYILPAYAHGRNLAESYYLGMPFLSWQGVVLGDPLCSLGKP
ncbi:MAG: TIGR03790 family protein [Bryobacteraceae bacterium]